MRPDKIGRGSSKERRSTAPRFVGKGRYTSAPPQTATVDGGAPEIEVQVGDVTLVVGRDEALRFDKYAARSAPAYRSLDDVGDEVDEPAPITDLLVDEPIPEWTAWRSEAVSSSAGYHRRETRLPPARRLPPR